MIRTVAVTKIDQRSIPPQSTYSCYREHHGALWREDLRLTHRALISASLSSPSLVCALLGFLAVVRSFWGGGGRGHGGRSADGPPQRKPHSTAAEAATTPQRHERGAHADAHLSCTQLAAPNGCAHNPPPVATRNLSLRKGERLCADAPRSSACCASSFFSEMLCAAMAPFSMLRARRRACQSTPEGMAVCGGGARGGKAGATTPSPSV